MDMKQHILTALHEKFADWEALLSRLSEAQATGLLPDSDWSVKDVIAHLMAWQQRSIARLEGAQHNREPEFPRLPEGLEPDAEGGTDRINAWFYATYRDQPWSQVNSRWRAGFQRFLGIAETIPERDLLDGDRYAWMHGYPLAVVLLASYDHHQEHYEKLQAVI